MRTVDLHRKSSIGNQNMGWLAPDSPVPEGPCFTLLARTNDLGCVNDVRLRLDLEKGDIATKIRALETLVRLCVLEPTRLSSAAGRPTLMAVIRFLLPLQDHSIKRMLLLFWEVVPKTDGKGELLQEMILVCDSFRRDLEHPNEFIRGATLRLLTKLPWNGELFEPLYPCVAKCLTHRHPYVRRNAALCLYSMGRKCRELQVDVINALDVFLSTDQDPSAKRNAFLALCELSEPRALRYVEETDWSSFDALERSGRNLLQGPAIQLIYRTGLKHPQESWRFIQSVFHLLQSPIASVRFEASRALFALTSASTALRTSGQALVDLAISQTDNTAKIVLLDTLDQLRRKHPQPLEFLAVDLIRVVAGASDIEVCRRALELAVLLTTERSASDLVELLKRELRRLQTSPHQQADSVQVSEAVLTALQNCLASFPRTTPSVITCLTELVSSESESVCISAVRILRETLIRFPEYAPRAVGLVLQHFPLLREPAAIRHVSWLLGEFCERPEHVRDFIEQVTNSLTELPKEAAVEMEQRECNGTGSDSENGTNSNKASGAAKLCRSSSRTDRGASEKKSLPVVTADGTYATQSAFIMANSIANGTSSPWGHKVLLSHMIKGNFFIGTCVCGAVTKAACRFVTTKGTSVEQDTTQKDGLVVNRHEIVARALRVIVFCLALADSSMFKGPATTDDRLRMMLCIRLLLLAQAGGDNVHSGLGGGQSTRQALNSFVTSTERRRELCRRKKTQKLGARGPMYLTEQHNSIRSSNGYEEADAPLLFDQLSGGNRLHGGPNTIDKQDIFSESLQKALSGNISSAVKDGDILANSLLAKVTQLTGRSDPLYAECYVHVTAHAIDLDVFVFNQTDDTLQNCTLELTTLGRLTGKRDMKLIDRPGPVVIGPHDFVTLRTTIKVTATDNGLIFGNISYDVKGSTSDTHVVVLNDIRINIVDFLVPDDTSQEDFRNTWAGLEWENKVIVSSPIRDLDAYLDLLIRKTNMACLTHGDSRLNRQTSMSNFLMANLSAKSLFNENVLANVCLERDPIEGELTGHVRVRARSQGLAWCLGDKISELQKCTKN
ncbi:coatomer subunit beta-like isoform X2 [Varroa destructor]|uniref:Coatomer subunit beta n=1 Tax=Varroa destructor TaxID=109461 RepID=A0A7M7KMJ1_VARDE|nr:coatomer subunit beta-like isoform X2 [Varroa destructor]